MPLYHVLLMQRPDIWWIMFGIVGSAVNGALLPLFGLIVGDVLSVFQYRGQRLTDGASTYSLVFVGLMCAQVLANFGQFAGFGVAGERLTKRIRM